MPFIPYAVVDEASPVAPFTPSDLPDLQAWWDASDTATITDAGAGAVSAWADKSGNGNTLTQGTGANRPTTGTRTINSKNVLDFDGSNDNLVSSLSVSDRASCIFAVGLIDDVAGNQRTLYGPDTDGGQALRLNQTTGVWQVEKSGLVALETMTFGPALSTPFVMMLNWKSNSLFGDMNADEQYLTRVSETTVLTAGKTLVLGAAGALRPWDGTIAEVIRYSATMQPGPIFDVMRYLTAKWAVS